MLVIGALILIVLAWAIIGTTIIREVGAAILACAGVLYLISTNGGDVDFWMPYVVWGCMALAAISIVTKYAKKAFG